MSAHSDILGGLSLEQLEEGIRLLELQITKADEEGRTDDAITYILTRNAIRSEMDGRTPTYVMTVTAHHAIRILSVHYPEKTVEELQRDNEYDVRMMWNERAKRSQSATRSHATRSHACEEKSVEMYMHSSQWPAMRPLAPLAIIHKEGESAFFTNAAPPVNAWWAAEDRAEGWELVWREWRGEEIHEGWVQRLEAGCMHYLARYKSGEASPLPLQSI